MLLLETRTESQDGTTCFLRLRQVSCLNFLSKDTLEPSKYTAKLLGFLYVFTQMNSTILDYFFDPSSFQLTSTSTTTFSFLNFHGSILSRGSSPCWLWIVGITGFTDSLTVDSFASSFVHIFIHSLMNIVSVNIEVNFMWAAHQVHHSSEDYNLTTALRQSAMQRYNSWVSTH